jgi:translocation and assembly module TamA
MIESRHRGRAQIITRHAWLWVLLLAVCCPVAWADQLEIVVTGVKEPLLGNVRNRVAALQVGGDIRLSKRRRTQLAEQSQREASAALRPYGYYHATVSSQWLETSEDAWRLQLTVEPGAPQTVATALVEVVGPGAAEPDLLAWKNNWPLGPGQVMDQTVWEARKQAALDAAHTQGYLAADFTEHVIAADLERNTAATRLVLDTGQQAVLGEVRYEQDAVRPGILAMLPRFSQGQPYDPWLLEKFRLDLWRTGYYKNVEVIEERRLEEDPPQVNLVVRGERRTPNTYQGSLGWGTDTGIRAQLQWSRFLLSDRGDFFDMGVGWQEEFNQYSFRSSYRMPRETRAREFWTGDFLVNRQRQEVQIKEDVTDEEYIQLTSGDVTDYSVKAGRLIVRDFARGYQQVFETWYGQYVYETVSFELTELARQLGYGDPEDELGRYNNNISALALGVNWDWPDVRGSGFATVGHHQRAWVAIANEIWGSNREFNQAYLSSSWHGVWGDRWKVLLRGEVGYSDATVRDVELEVEGRLLQLSVTQMPNLYRFKAGGSRSVRGYDFESLSDNGIGSNNIVTASAEIEMRIHRDWSLAAFFDAGNAFNDWDDFELLKGAGVGIRWYSIAGAIRLDVAQGLDLEGEPWRVHFTIGTPLL